MSTRRPSAIQRAIKQAKPFRSPAEEAIVSLMRTADVVRAELERTLGECDLTLQQYNVLRILRGMHPEPIPTLEIAERMIERAPGITRLLDRLEAVHLVARDRCREDRRRVLCRITAAGLAALEKADGPVLEAENERARRLPRAELTQLRDLLDRLREESN